VQRLTLKDFEFEDLEQRFPDDASCLEWLRIHLYPNGVFCKLCQRITKHHYTASRRSYSCDHCGHHVHPTAGTIFHKSSTSLRTWFHAIHLMACTGGEVSAKQIERETGVTYKTAWRMFKHIRTLFDEDPDIARRGTPGPETGPSGASLSYGRYRYEQRPGVLGS
jgi:transposase-like protein